MGANHLGDVLGAVGDHDEQFGSIVDDYPMRRVQHKPTQFLTQQASAWLARHQHIRPPGLAQPSRQPLNLGRLARPLNALEGDEQGQTPTAC
jgi:hypothetical protein